MRAADISVVIRSKDEADRLRLTLASFANQADGAEIIVVDDGSLDHTAAVLRDATVRLPITVVRHDVPQGRCVSSNAGARIASGDILLFMDGDCLAGPDLIDRHRAAHAPASSFVGRGETFHLRGTRFLQDPEAGTAQPGQADRLRRLPTAELASMRVTLSQVVHDFGEIERRAEPAIYPGAGPRALYELEMDALRNHPECSVLWAAASGHNLSVSRELFNAVGGFNTRMDDLNEHRELAYRLCRAGGRMAAVDGARTYHMTHRSGWRDPLRDVGWEDAFYRAHPDPAIRLLVVLWASLSGRGGLRNEQRILSLPGLEAVARGGRKLDVEGARRAIFAQPSVVPSERGRPAATASARPS